MPPSNVKYDISPEGGMGLLERWEGMFLVQSPGQGQLLLSAP